MDILTLKNSLCTVEQCTGTYLLKETGKDAILNKVYLCDIPCDSLIVKMDNIKFDKFFKAQNGWGFNKHCDYLIVTDDKLVFIQMKSKKEIDQTLITECIQKFSSDECTINYADLIFQKMLSKNSFFDKRETHYILLYQGTSIAKTPTTQGVIISNTTPNTFRAIPVANESTISFNRTI